MANDNQGSRTFLAIVLGGIVLALIIAAYFMYGTRSGTDVKVDTPATEEPMTPPAAPEPAPAPEPTPAPAPEPAPMPEPTPPAAETPAPEAPAPEAPAPEAPAPEAPAPQPPQ